MNEIPLFFQIVLVVAIIVLVFMIWRSFTRVHNSYIGFGWVLEYDKESGCPQVISRLIKSPSGQAGIYAGDKLLEYRGRQLHFDTAGEMVAFWKAERGSLSINQKVMLKVKRGDNIFDVEIEAALICDPIPVYDPLPPIPEEDRHLFNRGLAHCGLTGQWFETRRLSQEALDKIFG